MGVGGGKRAVRGKGESSTSSGTWPDTSTCLALTELIGQWEKKLINSQGFLE